MSNLIGNLHPSVYKNVERFQGSNHRSPKSFGEDLKFQNALRRILTPKSSDNTLGLFDIIHSKFVQLGQGYHGSPVHHFQYHMEEARWIHIQPLTLGKVVVSNTCPKVS